MARPIAFSSPESRATDRAVLAKMRGIMISRQILKVAGLVATAAAVLAVPAIAQVLQVPQLLPPADVPQLQAPSDQLGPQLLQPPTLNTPAAEAQAPDAQAPDTQAPDAQPPADTPVPPQMAEPEPTHISNPVAVFAGLDKITGRIISFDVYINETVQFGALQVTPRVCYTRPPTEEPRTDAFVEVDEITLSRKIQRIFTGWMFADSPGLHAVDNAVYDVWLTNCRMKSDVPPPKKK